MSYTHTLTRLARHDSATGQWLRAISCIISRSIHVQRQFCRQRAAELFTHEEMRPRLCDARTSNHAAASPNVLQFVGNAASRFNVRDGGDNNGRASLLYQQPLASRPLCDIIRTHSCVYLLALTPHTCTAYTHSSRLRNRSPLRVFVTMRVRLHGTFFDQEFHLLIERRGHRRRRLAQQNVQRIRRCQAHQRIATRFFTTALAVRTVDQAI